MPFYSPQDLRDFRKPLSLLTHEQAKAHEAQAHAALPAHTLMSRAGEALARLCMAKFPHAHRVLIICGSGNNGGDGFVAASWLASRGIVVEVHATDTADAAHDAVWARHACQQRLPIAPLEANTLKAALSRCDVVIDALFGAGLTRPLGSQWLELIELVNAAHKPVIAADIASGLHADTGCVMNDDAIAIKAQVTLALLCLRPGHYTGAAQAHRGELWLHDLGIPSNAYPQSPQLLTANSITLPRVSSVSHKGNRGTVGIIGGAVGMRGAPLLGARTALKLGAGRVHVGFLAASPHEAPPELDASEPSLMCHAITNTVWPFEADTWVFGPGAGMSDDATQLLNVLLAHTHDQALVLDADGLNLIASDEALRQALHLRTSPAVITPHPLEAARLLKCKTSEVQAHRLEAAAELARRYESVVVLKGAGTVIAAPDERRAINSSGGAWLATAGSGDVLAGAIAALLAQGLDAWNAACSAVYIHGCPDKLLANTIDLVRVSPVLASEQAAYMAQQMQALQERSG